MKAENLTEFTWYNELGSEMNFVVQGNIITGVYKTKVGQAQNNYELIGKIDNEGNILAIGWVVLWSNNTGNSQSVTTWSGQLKTINNHPTIISTWLLTRETMQQDDWQSTLVGQDTFTPFRPSEELIQKNIQKGLAHSHPVKH